MGRWPFLLQIGPSIGKASPTAILCPCCRARWVDMTTSNHPVASRSPGSASARDDGTRAGVEAVGYETYAGMFRHSNGILVGDPVWPEVGAYVRQCIGGKGTHLPWYWRPPSDWRDRLAPLYRGLAAATVFGPVHKVDDTLDEGGFISVLVPPPLCKVPREDWETFPDLVWINIFTNRRGSRVVRHHYCTVVAEAEVASWRRLGWKDVWIETGIPGGWANPASRALGSRAEQQEYGRCVAELQQAHKNDASDGDDHNEPASSSGAC